jgi:TolB-like protein/DNA-binding winged helix-turn-helix (wHTH) protein
MERLASKRIRIGAWSVSPTSGEMSRNGETVRVEVRTMRLLVCLADRPGEVVSIDNLLGQVWPDVAVSPDSVYQAVAVLRRLLGDDSKQPTYIETIPRLGYRMVAEVSPIPDTDRAMPAAVDGSGLASRFDRRANWPAAVAIGFAIVVAVFLFFARAANDLHPATGAIAGASQKSIAVLPFLDLTDDQMSHETFADGMTEELIGRLSKVPGLQVPAPTSSFAFKGKKKAVAEIAKALGVAYVLDGSVRMSGAKLRVSARLIRGDNGYVVWSETYDRSFDDVLAVQDSIAGEVTKALTASIDAEPAAHKSE